VFCVYRLLIGLSTVYFNSHNTVNYIVNIGAIFILLKYLCDSKPMQSKLLNRLEIVSYVTLLFFWIFMLLFSEFIPDA
jgi:membrane associated rhomboid family serine protease